jgi:hypothetical protein
VDSEPTQRMLEWMPGALSTISLTENDKYLDSINLGRMEQAFALIQNQARGSLVKPLVFQFEADRVSVPGGVWLSKSKITDEILKLLVKYKLANMDLFAHGNPFNSGDTFPVQEEASNLIVSYVADRVAARTGLDTITDVEIPYTVHSLDALGASTASIHREGEGLLAAAVANLEVPDGIERLEAHDYQELHQSFQEIREPFHALIDALSRRFKLDRQQSSAALEIRIQQALNEYRKQMTNYRKHATTRSVNKWVPICFQGFLSLLIPFSSPEAQLIEAGGIFTIEVMKNVSAAQETNIEHEDAFRMLCQLKKSITQRSAISQLV